MTDCPEALAIWRERLNHMLVEQAKNANPAQDFQLKQEIDRARAMIEGLQGSGNVLGGKEDSESEAKGQGSSERPAKKTQQGMGREEIAALLLTMTEVTGLDARFANLDDLSFKGMVMERPDFFEASLHEAIFDNADIRHAQFDRAQLSGASFRSARLTHCDFRDAIVQHAYFDKSKAKDCRFDRSQLRRASFCGAKLLNCTFEGARLDESTLWDAAIRGCTGRPDSAKGCVLGPRTVCINESAFAQWIEVGASLGDPLPVVVGLLKELFDAGHLRRWLRLGGHGDIVDDVPWRDAWSEVSYEAAEALLRKGVVDETFFQRLESEFGPMADRIHLASVQIGVRR